MSFQSVFKEQDEYLLQTFCMPPWEVGVVKNYDYKKELGAIVTDDGKEYAFSRRSVCSWVYNGGKKSVLKPHNSSGCVFPTKCGSPVMFLSEDGYTCRAVVMWEPKGLSTVLEAQMDWNTSCVLIDDEQVWRGYGWYMIEKLYPKESNPLSESFQIFFSRNGEWVECKTDPRGTEIRSTGYRYPYHR